MGLRCILGHKYGEWKYVRPVGRYEHKLKRVCERCGKVEFYEGITEVCIKTGKQVPYTFKN